METTALGRRTVMFSFPELETNLLAVYGDHRTYLCDTFLGPEPMDLVRGVFRAAGREQPIVVFNSHGHWDHVWGNAAFPGSLGLAHELCRVHLERDFHRELEANGRLAKGVVTPRFPDLLFSDEVTFPDDAVEFFHSPGHTDDSASCLDARDRVLYVGDNVEEPFPYLESPDLASYVTTLERYLCLRPAAYVGGHGRRFTGALLEANLAYVRNLARGEEVGTSGWGDDSRQRHLQNLAVLRQPPSSGGGRGPGWSTRGITLK